MSGKADREDAPTTPTSDPAAEPGPIRSFVRREGRITRAQRRALEDLWPRYGLEPEGPPLDPGAIFGRSAPCCFEIGFGNGDALVAMAAEHPDHDFLGADVYRPGIGSLLLKIEERGLQNIRIFRDDAVALLDQRVPDESLERVMLFFPDPWPKKRHHKRRILKPEFAEAVRRKLIPGGIFHMATDWQNYAEQMLEVMEQQAGFVNAAGPGQFSPDRGWRPPTRFERRGLKLGHNVWDLVYRRRS